MKIPMRQRRGFTLIEMMISVTLVVIVGLGLIVSVTMARQRAELDKQRIAAINAARSFIEEDVRNNLYPNVRPSESVQLDNFNTPDEVLDDLNATLSAKIYQVIAETGGRGSEIVDDLEAQDGARVEVEVTVSWNRNGTLSGHRMTETLRTYTGPDL